MKIGFIGLGIMGKPMVKNIIKGGYTDVLVNGRHQDVLDEMEACGAKSATYEEIGRQCDVVMTMLPNSPQVKEVMLGENGVAAYMQEGSMFIDMSSINPVASKEIAAVLAKKNIDMLDAPVSGGEPKAIDGSLSFMHFPAEIRIHCRQALRSCLSRFRRCLRIWDLEQASGFCSSCLCYLLHLQAQLP